MREPPAVATQHPGAVHCGPTSAPRPTWPDADRRYALNRLLLASVAHEDLPAGRGHPVVAEVAAHRQRAGGAHAEAAERVLDEQAAAGVPDIRKWAKKQTLTQRRALVDAWITEYASKRDKGLRLSGRRDEYGTRTAA